MQLACTYSSYWQLKQLKEALGHKLVKERNFLSQTAKLANIRRTKLTLGVFFIIIFIIFILTKLLTRFLQEEFQLSLHHHLRDDFLLDDLASGKLEAGIHVVGHGDSSTLA